MFGMNHVLSLTSHLQNYSRIGAVYSFHMRSVFPSVNRIIHYSNRQKRYQKEKTKNAELRRMLSKCKGGGNKVDLLKQILENEDTIASVTKQVQ